MGNQIVGSFSYDPNTPNSSTNPCCAAYYQTVAATGVNLTIDGSSGIFTFTTPQPIPAPPDTYLLDVVIQPNVFETGNTYNGVEVVSPVVSPAGFVVPSNVSATVDILLTNEMAVGFGPTFLTSTAIPTNWSNINISLYQQSFHPPIVDVAGIWAITFELDSLQ